MKDPKYCELLLKNSSFHKRVIAGNATYNSDEWKLLQKELAKIELKMSSSDIISHAEYLFPTVGM